MNYKVKFLSLFSLFFLSFFSVFADETNKEILLDDISELKTLLETLETSQLETLSSNLEELSGNYDEVYEELGYTSEYIDYLISLGELSSNYKEDLVSDFIDLKSEINSDINEESDIITSMEDTINYTYSTISDSKKDDFLEEIDDIKSDIEDLESTCTTKIENFYDKYTSSLSSYKETVENVFDSNKSSLYELEDFSADYEELYTMYETFSENYEIFKTYYLSFAGELSDFSEEKQELYVETLKGELEEIRDANVEANPSLEDYTTDIDRLMDILLENFENSLSIKMDDNYGIIYSESDIEAFISTFNEIETKYYNSDGELMASNVLSSSGAIESVNNIYEKLSEVNENILSLIGENEDNYNELENVKIRMENEMIRFYNDNYEDYREDLILKLKEKLNIISLETKNVLLVSDTIDLKVSLLNDKISGSNDLDYINEEIEEFKDSISKYSYLESSILDQKISNLNTTLDLYVVKKELGLEKYSQMLDETYVTQLDTIILKLETKYPNTYIDKLDTVLSKVDILLEDSNLSVKMRFILLVIKREILESM